MRKKGIPFRVAGELNNTEALKNIVRADREGFAVISELAIDASLRVLEIPGLNLERSFDIVYHKDKRMGGDLADLVDRIGRISSTKAARVSP
jgi:DNA-binding transcriptional LysR family regulator